MLPLDPRTDFPHYYSRAIQTLGIDYEGLEFLYPSDGPWPRGVSVVRWKRGGGMKGMLALIVAYP